MKKVRFVVAAVGVGLPIALLANPRQNIADFTAGFREGYDAAESGR